MRNLIIAGLLAAVAAPLLAQPIAAPMGAGKIVTRGDVQTRVQAQFARRDANRDGVLTTEELVKRGGQRGARMHRRGQIGGQHAMRGPNAAFDRLDANRDGAISRDEFARGRDMRAGKRVAQGGTHHRSGGMFKRADANRDGRVTLAEATSGALRHFDMIDANRDDRVTPQERVAGRAHMRQMRSRG